MPRPKLCLLTSACRAGAWQRWSLRQSAVALCAGGCILLAAGCGRRETPVELGNRLQILHQGVGADPNDLDPQIVSTNQAAAISMALGEGLTNYDPKDLHPVPGVAENWEVSPDGLVYTFHLRANARWSNGEPVTAEDFIFSAHRILSPAFAGEFAYMFFPVRGAEDFNTGRAMDFNQVGVRALDQRTLRYELRQPAPYFLTLVAHWSWYPVHPATILKFGRLDEPGTAWTRPGNFTGNGPFALAKWQPGQGAVVKKNPHYWDAARVRLQEIDFHFIDSRETEERAFRDGQLHLTAELPRTKIETYRAQTGGPLRMNPVFETDMVQLNLQKPPLDNPLVRQALSLAIDRTALGGQVLRDGSQPANSLLPDDASGYTYRGEPRLHFEPTEARRLLAAAGYPDGRNFPKLEIAYPNDGVGVIVCEALQQMWRKHLGLEVALLGQERRVFVDNLHGHRLTLAFSGWIGDYLDPMSFLDVFLATSGHNDPGYINPAYDRLLSAAAGTADPAQRYAIFAQAESQLMRDLPILPLYHRPNLHLVNPAVHGFESNLMDMHPYQEMWLENK
jgi:oligopeptide transport system substrate-binding protein